MAEEFEKNENLEAEFEEEDIVELVDDEGNAIKFCHVATIDYEGNWYVFFSPSRRWRALIPTR